VEKAGGETEGRNSSWIEVLVFGMAFYHQCCGRRQQQLQAGYADHNSCCKWQRRPNGRLTSCITPIARTADETGAFR